MISAERIIQAAFGPIRGALPISAAELTGQGILSKADLGTTAFRAFAGPGGGGTGKAYRCKLVVVSAANVAWATVNRGASAPVIKADADGSADEGSLVYGGGGIVEHFTIDGSCDLYIVASAANTIVNLTIVEA
jgi:hypothetical protein